MRNENLLENMCYKVDLSALREKYLNHRIYRKNHEIEIQNTENRNKISESIKNFFWLIIRC